ncbi:uncharacterized protein BO95DRAFT_276778 [Aspergillus brunneoviolaceus CBS 621.78]|uniref:Uncharacterized protein n=1 Tax=Aspergillus brunneoviolaceus CBS 621.78 TaxID=1450534 RepID=A0ACD1FW52_9EURO|nr:hypothetical protein BO95DRAFT_276778 [Aspergillus brunneoviolaceus CBS 621.78]RAH41160.1 hypothetical protein BO95DRAFT_276778 [Aspergillus brunneoviolaceus CBS 621.78]
MGTERSRQVPRKNRNMFLSRIDTVKQCKNYTGVSKGWGTEGRKSVAGEKCFTEEGGRPDEEETQGDRSFFCLPARCSARSSRSKIAQRYCDVTMLRACSRNLELRRSSSCALSRKERDSRHGSSFNQTNVRSSDGSQRQGVWGGAKGWRRLQLVWKENVLVAQDGVI